MWMAIGANRTAAPASTAATIFLEKRVPVDEPTNSSAIWLSESVFAHGVLSMLAAKSIQERLHTSIQMAM